MDELEEKSIDPAMLKNLDLLHPCISLQSD